MLQNFSEVYMFEAGSDEILGERRQKLRNLNLNFKQYKIIPEATHNFHGAALKKLFIEMDKIFSREKQTC